MLPLQLPHGGFNDLILACYDRLVLIGQICNSQRGDKRHYLAPTGDIFKHLRSGKRRHTGLLDVTLLQKQRLSHHIGLRVHKQETLLIHVVTITYAKFCHGQTLTLGRV